MRMELLFVVDTTRLLIAVPLFLNKQSVASQPASLIIAVPSNDTRHVGPHFDADVPLRFTRDEFVWRDHPPFLPWADGLVARGARPFYTTISFFEIENPVLEFVDTTALRTERPIGASFSVDAVFLVFNFMRLHNLVSSRCSSTEHFIAVIRAANLQLTPDDLAVFTIRANAVCKT